MTQPTTTRPLALVREVLTTWTAQEHRIFRFMVRQHGLRYALAAVRDPYWHG